LQLQGSSSLGRPVATSNPLGHGQVARIRSGRAPIYRDSAHPVRGRSRSLALIRPALLGDPRALSSTALKPIQ
jgi:hypothetical protein